MADENTPAFYPRVGKTIAKNFRSAQPPAFIEDPRAMDLPQYGDVDLSVPSKENLELSRRMAERDAQLRRQQEADRSPLEKLAGGIQAGRFLGSAMTQGINSIPTRLAYGDKAAEKFMEDRIYKPEQPLAYEYAGDVGDFLEKLETEYKIPPLMPEAVALQYLTAPATSQAARAASKGAVKAGMALERRMEPVVKGALEQGGLPREMAMAMGANTQSNVIKPSGKGANWLDGKRGSVEAQLSKMKMSDQTSPEAMAEMQKSIDTAKRIMADDPDAQRAVNQMENELAVAKRNNAVNSWIDSNLRNYVKNQMATPDDPVRKLAEEGILHMAPYGEQGVVSSRLMNKRMGLGQDPLGMGRSDPARFWERISDISVDAYPAGSYKHGSLDESLLADNPWLQKVPDKTMIYSGKGLSGDLGFDHIIDVLRQDVREGRIRPEQLNKVSMEQAVRRVHEYDQEMAKKMRETALQQQEGFPVHKEYPEGYKWIELKMPDYNSLPIEERKQMIARLTEEARQKGLTPEDYIEKYPQRQLEEALKYEGETMGHCVGGYCPDVIAGKSRIYSLRDSKGEPHVTVEVNPVDKHPIGYGMSGGKSFPDDFRYESGSISPEQHQQIYQRAKQLFNPELASDLSSHRMDVFQQAANEIIGKPADQIIQIKGKQNAAPKADYLPFVQDFVRGNNWSDVRDFNNTGLRNISNAPFEVPRTHGEKLGMKFPKYLTSQEYDDLFNHWNANSGSNPPNTDIPESLKKYLPTPPDVPPDLGGMKRGGKVSISNNPDTMMLEVNNQKMKNGVPAYGAGSAVTKMGLKAAKMEVPRIAMQFGNDLPLNMSEVENLTKRFPEPVVDRVNMAHKDVLKRTPELQEAAARIEAGDMSADEYARLVKRYKPVTPYETVPAPASREEILAALSKTSREAEGLPRKETYFGKPSSTLKEGDPVGLRLDIPSYNQANTWVVTAHGPRKSPVSGGAGTRIGYEPVAAATDVDFSVSPKAALGIAKGAEKNTIATMEGKWKPTSSDEAFTLAKQYLKNPEWRQVGMDPERHSFFYDRETMAPVTNAEEVIQIGPLVLAKNPKYGKLEDFKYQKGGLAHASEPHYGAGALVVKEGLKAAKPAKIDVPIRFPVSRGPTVPEIRAMAERMAPQVMGEFVREAPTASKPNPSANVVGKSKKQFDREQNLQIGYQDIKPPVTPQEFDYAAHKDDLLIGAAGDVTPANRMLHSIDNQPLSHAVHQQGGPEWALYNPSGWAATDEMAKTWMKRADKAAEAYGAQPHLHYHKMTPDANWYAMHHLHSLLGHMRPEELKFKNPELYSKMVDEISSKDVGFGKHPEFEGFDDPLNLNIHAQIDPHFRRHLGKVLGSPTFAERYGLNSGVDVMAATSLPDLRNLEVGSSGYAVVPLDTKAPLQHFAADSQTYDTGFPMKGEPKRSKYPSPYELIYRDTLNWMKAHPSENKSSEFGRMNMIVPKQQIDNELIDAIGEYQRRMKELTGKKKGGAVKKPVKKAAGGAITGDDLIIEERPL